MSKTKISAYVSRLRKEEGSTIREFAKAHGLSTNHAFRYENGDIDKPTRNAARKFCSTFGISLSSFVADFYYEDEKIKNSFINQENLKSRFFDYLTDSDTEELMIDFFDSVEKVNHLKNLKFIKIKDIKDNKYSIYYRATCEDENGEKIVLCPVIFMLGDSTPIFEHDYSMIVAPIGNIALVEKKYLPEKSDKYVFFIPNKLCFNFLRDIEYDKTIAKNNVILFYIDGKEIKDKFVLFGNDFLSKEY